MNVTPVSGVSSPGTAPVAPVEPAVRTLPLSGQVRPASAGSEAAEQRQEAPAAQPNAQDVRNAVDKLNRTLSALDTQARFLVNEELNQIVVQVLDVRTNTVIKQIPPQQVLDAVVAMLRLVGLLVDGKG